MDGVNEAVMITCNETRVFKDAGRTLCHNASIRIFFLTKVLVAFVTRVLILKVSLFSLQKEVTSSAVEKKGDPGVCHSHRCH